jgi:hypothetical protein
MKVANYLDYRLFDYADYLDNKDRVIPKPKKLRFDLGDIVYIKSENSVGVVIGCIVQESGELRTDMDGMQCFSNLRLATKKDLKRKSLRITPKLFSEIYTKV